MFKYAGHIGFLLLFLWWGFLALSIVTEAKEVQNEGQVDGHGWAYYQDTQYTPESPFIVLPQHKVRLNIDAGKINEFHLPEGSKSFFDSYSMTLTPDEPGSFFIVRFDMLIASTHEPFELVFRLEVPGGRSIIASEITIPAAEFNDFRMTSVTFPFYTTKEMVKKGLLPTIESKSGLKVAGVGVLVSKIY